MNENYTPCSPDCPGWDLFDEGNNVQRCDECKRFVSDVEALHYALHHDLERLRGRASEYLEMEQLEERLSNALTCTRKVDTGCVILGPDDSKPGEKSAYIAEVYPLDSDGSERRSRVRVWLNEDDKLRWRSL